MKKLLDRIFKLEEINGRGVCPAYLYRWTLLRVGKAFAIYLHKFVGDDWSLDLHDNPKRFWSIGLRGRYTEWTLTDGVLRQPHVWRAPWFRTFSADHTHRLTGPTTEHPCWTVVIVGKPVREWGFWRGVTWIPWRTYVRSEMAEERKACP